ncbi:hypothetical protein AVEN_208892-1 [Araneus ventricosus]|uniref:Uncharacterized protein n=1 Tax=Araneus ventricosus TaxID=182803 RepID=A0A4Y2EZN5_ARAVE|nr:hypothetical protein AVEN_208892-1 [Araneus ventricosus]
MAFWNTGKKKSNRQFKTDGSWHSGMAMMELKINTFLRRFQFGASMLGEWQHEEYLSRLEEPRDEARKSNPPCVGRRRIGGSKSDGSAFGTSDE